ncbi:MAG TPA: four helix bundle protein [Thermodesulfovibrionales bacterium]|nr:four helix bundle protein [Thermodesulfovibrionales bacterium]
MGSAKTFKDLFVWQKAHELVIEVYRSTKPFPPEERFGLVSQMRRTAVSIPANIAEGFVKRSIKDKSNFYNISQGSLEELKYYLILSEDLGYAKNGLLTLKANEVGKLLNGLLSSLP